MYSERGKTDGFHWSVQCVEAVDGRVFAHVQVGTTIKITPKTYKDEDQAKEAGRQLRDDTLAELEDLVNA